MPPQRCIELAAQAEIIVASPLPRALFSLEKPGLRATYTDAMFREVALPALPLRRPRFRPRCGPLCYVYCGCAAIPAR